MSAGGTSNRALFRPRRFLLLPALAALAACAPPPSAAPPAPEEATLLTEDGVRLAATRYPVAADAPPALIVVAGPGESRADWAPLATAIQRAGYMTLAIDPRGQGESRRGPDGPGATSIGEESWRAAAADFAAAHRALLDNGADPENIALAAAGAQTVLALAYARANPAVQGVILVSPELEFRDLDAAALIRDLADRPILIQFATGDTYAAAAGRRLNERAEGFTELREYQGAAHGAGVYAVSENARQQVLLWLDTILRPAGAE